MQRGLVGSSGSPEEPCKCCDEAADCGLEHDRDRRPLSKRRVDASRIKDECRLTSFQHTELLSTFPKSKSRTPADRSARSAKPSGFSSCEALSVAPSASRRLVMSRRTNGSSSTTKMDLPANVQRLRPEYCASP